MYCTKCGADLSEEMKFCTNCGMTINEKPSEEKDVMLEQNDVSADNMKIEFSSLPLRDYYKKEFEKIYNSNEKYKGKFNWRVLRGGPIWVLVRGSWLSGIISLAILMIVVEFFDISIAFPIAIAIWIFYAFRGTYLFYCAYVKKQQKLF